MATTPAPHPGAPGPAEVDERFATSPEPRGWTIAHLPAWSSRASAAATSATGTDGLHLTIPATHPVWCPGVHEPPLRDSAVQSGS